MKADKRSHIDGADINRDILECKLQLAKNLQISFLDINRDILECK